MKLVINKCYGGFGLSPKAEQLYNDILGRKIYFYETKYDSKTKGSLKRVTDLTKLERGLYSVFLADIGDKGEKLPKNSDKIWFYSDDIERNDPVLVRVVEELGEEANTPFSKLKVVEVPDNVDWELEEYDGIEWVAEKHRVWR